MFRYALDALSGVLIFVAGYALARVHAAREARRALLGKAYGGAGAGFSRDEVPTSNDKRRE